MDESKEEKPAEVPRDSGTKQAGETRHQWWWADPEIWTDRMLAALEKGVKGGKWFSLIDKVYSPDTLFKAFKKVKANQGSAGVDRQTIEQFEAHLPEHLEKLAQELRDETYRPLAIQRKYIPKPGSQEMRPLGVPTIRDRVVQSALRSVIEPIFEVEFSDRSYGFRPGRGCKDALRQVDMLLHQGYTWVVDVDLKSYFDTIPHAELMTLVEKKISDGRVLRLIKGYLEQSVLDGMEEWTPDRGSPQGAIVSPLLSNIYLHPLDLRMEADGREMIRYADDMVVLCQTRSEAEQALAVLQEWTKGAGLTLHPEKTRIVDATRKGGFDFLGYHFEQGRKWPRKKSMKKVKDAVRKETKRTSGSSLEEIASKVNRVLRGWFEYFKHSHRNALRDLDKWIRMRLRSILRKRRGGRGKGRGSDHQRWPNAFFTGMGLFFLGEAHAQACQPQS
jgi:RNA-directed DNA polymerase